MHACKCSTPCQSCPAVRPLLKLRCSLPSVRDTPENTCPQVQPTIVITWWLTLPRSAVKGLRPSRCIACVEGWCFTVFLLPMLRRLGYTGPLSRTLSLRVKTRARVTTCYLSLSLSPFLSTMVLSVVSQYPISNVKIEPRPTCHPTKQKNVKKWRHNMSTTSVA